MQAHVEILVIGLLLVGWSSCHKTKVRMKPFRALRSLRAGEDNHRRAAAHRACNSSTNSTGISTDSRSSGNLATLASASLLRLGYSAVSSGVSRMMDYYLATSPSISATPNVTRKTGLPGDCCEEDDGAGSNPVASCEPSATPPPLKKLVRKDQKEADSLTVWTDGWLRKAIDRIHSKLPPSSLHDASPPPPQPNSPSQDQYHQQRQHYNRNRFDGSPPPQALYPPSYQMPMLHSSPPIPYTPPLGLTPPPASPTCELADSSNPTAAAAAATKHQHSEQEFRSPSLPPLPALYPPPTPGAAVPFEHKAATKRGGGYLALAVGMTMLGREALWDSILKILQWKNTDKAGLFFLLVGFTYLQLPQDPFSAVQMSFSSIKHRILSVMESGRDVSTSVVVAPQPPPLSEDAGSGVGGGADDGAGRRWNDVARRMEFQDLREIPLNHLLPPGTTTVSETTARARRAGNTALSAPSPITKSEKAFSSSSGSISKGESGFEDDSIVDSRGLTAPRGEEVVTDAEGEAAVIVRKIPKPKNGGLGGVECPSLELPTDVLREIHVTSPQEVFWNYFVVNKMAESEKYRDVAADLDIIVNTTFPVSASEFWSIFLRDNAPFSLARYHCLVICDDDMQHTLWRSERYVDGEGREEHIPTRRMSFMSQLKQRLGPSSALVYKTQRLTGKFPDGFWMEDSTVIPHVPYGSSFTAVALWNVKDDGPGACRVVIRCKTIFQRPVWVAAGMIRRMVRSSTQEWYEKYIASALEHLPNITAKTDRIPDERTESKLEGRRRRGGRRDRSVQRTGEEEEPLLMKKHGKIWFAVYDTNDEGRLDFFGKVANFMTKQSLLPGSRAANMSLLIRLRSAHESWGASAYFATMLSRIKKANVRIECLVDEELRGPLFLVAAALADRLIVAPFALLELPNPHASNSLRGSYSPSYHRSPDGVDFETEMGISRGLWRAAVRRRPAVSDGSPGDNRLGEEAEMWADEVDTLDGVLLRAAAEGKELMALEMAIAGESK